MPTESAAFAAPMERTGAAQAPAHAYAASTSNNFDAIRLFAALLVLISHHFFFLGKSQPAPTGNTLGEVAVMVFFTISGYLVAESWYRDPHLVRFALRRMLRLWPALAVATGVIVLMCSAITTLPLHDYFGRDTWHFVTRNLQLRSASDLPGVFTTYPGNPMSAVNGSWWTIPLEVKCYTYLAALGLVGLRRRWASVLALAVAAFWYVKTLPGHSAASLSHNLSYFYTAFFMAGVCARQFRPELLCFRKLWLGAGAAILILSMVTGTHALAEWAVIVPATLIVGSVSTPWLRSAGRFGDLSYGIYIYAYFVQQLVVRYWPGTPTLVGSLLVSIVLTTALAWCSWHAVEAPALKLKHRLRHWFPDHAA